MARAEGRKLGSKSDCDVARVFSLRPGSHYRFEVSSFAATSINAPQSAIAMRATTT